LVQRWPPSDCPSSLALFTKTVIFFQSTSSFSTTLIYLQFGLCVSFAQLLFSSLATQQYQCATSHKQEEGKYQKCKRKREGDLAGPLPSIAIAVAAAGIAHPQLGLTEDTLHPLPGHAHPWELVAPGVALVLPWAKVGWLDSPFPPQAGEYLLRVVLADRNVLRMTSVTKGRVVQDSIATPVDF
jgi:hypothetical protein